MHTSAFPSHKTSGGGVILKLQGGSVGPLRSLGIRKCVCFQEKDGKKIFAARMNFLNCKHKHTHFGFPPNENAIIGRVPEFESQIQSFFRVYSREFLSILSGCLVYLRNCTSCVAVLLREINRGRRTLV